MSAGAAIFHSSAKLGAVFTKNDVDDLMMSEGAVGASVATPGGDSELLVDVEDVDDDSDSEGTAAFSSSSSESDSIMSPFSSKSIIVTLLRALDCSSMNSSSAYSSESG